MISRKCIFNSIVNQVQESSKLKRKFQRRVLDSILQVLFANGQSKKITNKLLLKYIKNPRLLKVINQSNDLYIVDSINWIFTITESDYKELVESLVERVEAMSDTCGTLKATASN